MMIKRRTAKNIRARKVDEEEDLDTSTTVVKPHKKVEKQKPSRPLVSFTSEDVWLYGCNSSNWLTTHSDSQKIDLTPVVAKNVVDETVEPTPEFIAIEKKDTAVEAQYADNQTTQKRRKRVHHGTVHTSTKKKMNIVERRSLLDDYLQEIMDEGDDAPIIIEDYQSKEEEEEDNVDMDKFELAQLRNAGVLKQNDIEEDDIDSDEAEQKRNEERKLKIKIGSYSKMDNEKALMSMESVESALRSSLLALEADYEHNQQALDHTNREIEENATTLSFLQRELSDLSERFVYYQQIREYIEVLIECLDSIVPQIEMSMDHILSIQTKYHDSLYNDWLLMMQDETKLLEGRLSVQEKNLRQQRQFLRNQKTGSDRKGNWIVERDYYDQTNGQRFIEFEKSLNEVIQQLVGIFEDIEDEYCNIEKIKTKFENWKEFHTDSYRDTYCGTYIQKIFAPFVRLELIGCSIHVDNQHKDETGQWKLSPFQIPTLTKFHWWKELINYGLINPDAMSDEDPIQEEDLVPELVRKVVLPVVIHAFKHIYNPLSTVQNAQAVKLVHELLDYLDVNSDEMKLLYSTLSNRITRYVNDLQLPQFVTSEEGMNFLTKQLESGLVLLTSAVSWGELFNIDNMYMIISQELIQTKIGSALSNNQTISEEDVKKYLLAISSLKLPPTWRHGILSCSN